MPAVGGSDGLANDSFFVAVGGVSPDWGSLTEFSFVSRAASDWFGVWTVVGPRDSDSRWDVVAGFAASHPRQQTVRRNRQLLVNRVQAIMAMGHPSSEKETSFCFHHSGVARRMEPNYCDDGKEISEIDCVASLKKRPDPGV